VHIGGEANSVIEEAEAKAIGAHEKRRDVYKCVKSSVCDPKPGFCPSFFLFNFFVGQ